MRAAWVAGSALGISAISLLPVAALQQNSAPIPYSNNVLRFTGSVPRANTNFWYQQDPDKDIELEGTAGGSEYLLHITIAGQPFQVLLDTGSSDLWVVGENTTCYENGTVTSCNLGDNSFVNSLNVTSFSSDYNFNLTYATSKVIGTPYRGAVTLGDITVPDAEFNVATVVTDFAFNGTASGLMGFAYKSLTSLHQSADPENDSPSNRDTYLPWFPKAASEGLVKPYFAVALNRPTQQEEVLGDDIAHFGFLTLGGIPPNHSVPVTGRQVTVPNLKLPGFGYPKRETNFIYYAVSVDSWNFNGSEQLNTSSPVSIIDSGTYGIEAPQNVARAWNAQVVPPAVFNQSQGCYTCDCNATIPALSVKIAGHDFAFRPADLITYQGDGTCCTTIQATVGNPQSSPIVLGTSFLVNVLAAFDLKSNEITLYERIP